MHIYTYQYPNMHVYILPVHALVHKNYQLLIKISKKNKNFQKLLSEISGLLIRRICPLHAVFQQNSLQLVGLRCITISRFFVKIKIQVF